MLLCQCQGSKVTIFSFPHFRPPEFFLPYDLILGLYFVIIRTFFKIFNVIFIRKIVKVNLETALKFLFCFLFSFPSRVMMLLFHKLQEFTAWIETSISFYSTCEDFFSLLCWSLLSSSKIVINGLPLLAGDQRLSGISFEHFLVFVR